MQIKMTKRLKECLQSIGTIVEDEDIPVHPTLYRMWEDGTLFQIGSTLDLPVGDWERILGDMNFYEEWQLVYGPTLAKCLGQLPDEAARKEFVRNVDVYAGHGTPEDRKEFQEHMAKLLGE